MAVVEIKKLAAKRSVNFIDATRNYVRENSDHGDGPWFDKYATKYDYVVKMLYLESVGSPNAERPVLQCAPHAYAMATILQHEGYRFRFVRALSSFHNPMEDHVTLEVLNKETGGWELHDPNYNVKYVFAQSKQTASLFDVATARNIYSDLIPCVVGNFGSCGWDSNDARKLLKASYYSGFEVQGYGTIFFNNDRADFKRLVSIKGGTKEQLSLREAFLRTATSVSHPLTVIDIAQSVNP